MTPLGVTLGWLRSEAMLDNFGVTEDRWQDACATDPGFTLFESPACVARGIAALAADAEVGRFSGTILSSRQLADVYQLTDTDGSRPDCWGLLAARGWNYAPTGRFGETAAMHKGEVVTIRSKEERGAMEVGENQRAALVMRLRLSGCVFAEAEAELLLASSATAEVLNDRVAQREAGRPLEYILGWAEFFGRRIHVEPGVFVPRRRTEFLVQQVLTLPIAGNLAIAVDLCCGTGAVGVAIAMARPNWQVHAVDIDSDAVRCARRNLDPGVQVYQGDLYDPLPRQLRGRVTVLVANAPYVPTAAIDTMPQEARRHEPAWALDGGVDGMDIQRRIITQAGEWLASDGYLLIETSALQAERTAELCALSGLCPQVAASEALDATVVIARHTGL